MKKRISAFILSLALMSTVAYADYSFTQADGSYDSNPAPSSVVTELGNAVELTGQSSFSIEKDKGIYRVYYWVSPTIDAADNVVLNIESEHVKKNVNMDLKNSNMGWKEVCFAPCGTGTQLVITVLPQGGKKTLFTGLKLEKVDENEFAELAAFTHTNIDHVILATNSRVVYKDSERRCLKFVPIVKEGHFYVAVSDLQKIVDVKSFEKSQLSVIQKNGVDYADVNAIFEGIGQNSIVYEDSLAIFSNSVISYDANKDRAVLKNIRTVLRKGN